MIKLGEWNTLEVTRLEDRGAYVDGGESGEILLPTYEGAEGVELGTWMNVFIYNDSKDRLIATTKTPKITVGEFAALRVTEVNHFGAFLDWGLAKDLMLPFGEQKRKVSHGVKVVVAAYVDEKTGRLAATTKLGRFLGKENRHFLEDEQVDILVIKRSTLGYHVVVEGSHWGMIFHNQIFQPIEIGQRLKAYVYQVRDDDKIDIVLQKPGAEKIHSLADTILDKLSQEGGFIPLGDKSDSIEIRAMFSVSKKVYKKAIGQLYREKKILLEGNGVRLIDADKG